MYILQAINFNLITTMYYIMYLKKKNNTFLENIYYDIINYEK